MGGVAQIGDATYMVFGAGHLYEASSPAGPFVPSKANHAFLTQEGHLAFPRLWGGVYTQDDALVLLTHQQVNRGSIYAGLVKRVVLGADGVLRAVWWTANDVLRAAALPILQNASAPERALSTPHGGRQTSTRLEADALRRLGAPSPDGGDWAHVTDQIGMFAYTGLAAAHVDALREQHHVYMTRDGRMSMAALKPADVDYVAGSIKAVLG